MLMLMFRAFRLRFLFCLIAVCFSFIPVHADVTLKAVLGVPDTSPWVAGNGLSFYAYPQHTANFYLSEHYAYSVFIDDYGSIVIQESYDVPESLMGAPAFNLGPNMSSSGLRLVMSPPGHPEDVYMLAPRNGSQWHIIDHSRIEGLPSDAPDWEYVMAGRFAQLDDDVVYLISKDYVASVACSSALEQYVCLKLADSGAFVSFNEVSPPHHPIGSIGGAGFTKESQNVFVTRNGVNGGPSELLVFTATRSGELTYATTTYLPSGTANTLLYDISSSWSIVLWTTMTDGVAQIFSYDLLSNIQSTLNITFSEGEAWGAGVAAETASASHRFVAFSGVAEGTHFTAHEVLVNMATGHAELQLNAEEQFGGGSVPKLATEYDFYSDGWSVESSRNSTTGTNSLLLMLSSGVWGGGRGRGHKHGNRSRDSRNTFDFNLGADPGVHCVPGPYPPTCKRCKCGPSPSAECSKSQGECYVYSEQMCCCTTPPY